MSRGSAPSLSTPRCTPSPPQRTPLRSEFINRYRVLTGVNDDAICPHCHIMHPFPSPPLRTILTPQLNHRKSRHFMSPGPEQTVAADNIHTSERH